jgi:cobalamin biosynthesis Mg chelatase CobN
MWRSKKFIVAAVLAAVMLLGSIGGVVLAANNGEDSEAETKYEELLDRVCEIYEENTGVAINSEALKDAFAQAQSEVRAEAMQNRLQNLVDQGTITQGEADEYLEWWESKPDVPVQFGFGGPGGFHGMGGPRGWGALSAPTE